MSMLNTLIDEYQVKLNLYNKVKDHAKTMISQNDHQPLPKIKILSVPHTHTISTKERVDLSVLSKDVSLNSKPSSPKSIATLYQKQNFGNKQSSNIKKPLLQTESRMKIITLQDSFGLNPKFKKIITDESIKEATVEELFPLPKLRMKAKSLGNIWASQKFNLSQFVKKQFQNNKKVICIVFFKYSIIKHNHISFPFPYDMTQDISREAFRELEQKIQNSFQFLLKKKCFLFDLQRNPICSLHPLVNHHVILMSLLPKLEYKIDERLKQYCLRQQKILQNAFQQNKINLKEFISLNQQREIQKNTFIKEYCENPIKVKYSNSKDIRDLQKINQMYSKIQQVNENDHPIPEQNPYFKISPKKKDFTDTQINFLRTKMKRIDSSQRKAKSKSSISIPTEYKLTHRELMEKIPKDNNLIIKTKFNRNELLSLKSIFNAIISINLKKYKNFPQILKLGIEKQVFFDAIRQYGFEISQNLLIELLKNDKYINWQRFLTFMETIVHKTSNESIDEYLSILENSNSISYDELVRIIRFGLERLLVKKDKFYEGFEQVYAKQIFEVLKKNPSNQYLQTSQLKNLLKVNKTFRYIFFQ